MLDYGQGFDSSFFFQCGSNAMDLSFSADLYIIPYKEIMRAGDQFFVIGVLWRGPTHTPKLKTIDQF